MRREVLAWGVTGEERIMAGGSAWAGGRRVEVVVSEERRGEGRRERGRARGREERGGRLRQGGEGAMGSGVNKLKRQARHRGRPPIRAAANSQLPTQASQQVWSRDGMARLFARPTCRPCSSPHTCVPRIEEDQKWYTTAEDGM